MVSGGGAFGGWGIGYLFGGGVFCGGVLNGDIICGGLYERLSCGVSGGGVGVSDVWVSGWVSVWVSGLD